MEEIKKEKSEFIKTKIKELREKIAKLVQSLKLKNLTMMMKIKLVG
jgi:hypothetical protein